MSEGRSRGLVFGAVAVGGALLALAAGVVLPRLFPPPEVPTHSAGRIEPTNQPAGLRELMQGATARPVDHAVLAHRGRALSGPVEENVAPEASYRLDLHQDEGAEALSRALLDLDRDGAWDERWTFPVDEEPLREVAPADDGQYTRRWRWRTEGWRLIP